MVSVRSKRTLSEFSTEWAVAASDLLGDAAPWRTFRWYRGQKHYSGTYWSSTERSHVIYESRLELARLLYADFDEAVRGIVAQPFLLTATVNRRVRRHVPDFFLLTSRGPVVVDVKPRARLTDPRVRATLDWTRELVERRGWHYDVWSEPPATELTNVRFLAGYRHQSRFDESLLDVVRQSDLSGRTLGEALDTDFGRPAALVRAAVFHLVWSRFLAVDVAQPLSRSSVLSKGPQS
jgi:hypothetical protein